MNRRRWVVAIAALAALVLVVVGRPWQGPAPLPAALSALPSSPAPRAVGVAGCSGVNCHGGKRLAGPASPFAASVWLDEDRHGHAFAALSGETADRIMRLLCSGEAVRPATQDERCLACHTNPTTVFSPGTCCVDERPEAWVLRGDGVSCEACHGDAGPWLTAHTAWNGRGTEDLSNYVTHKMTRLHEASDRAAVCVSCHVGAPADAGRGLPRREVTHEMLASGHPRLAFEQATYQQALPPHWSKSVRDNPASSWLAGQTATAAATLRLLGDAVDGAGPEFAHFDCYACHHDLAPPGRRPFGEEGRLVGNRWELWLPLTRLALGQPALHKEVGQAMRSLDRAALAHAAEVLQAQLQAERPARADAAKPEQVLGTLLRDGMRNDDWLAHLRWDDAAQLCLALRAWRDAVEAPPAELLSEFDQLDLVLRFRAGEGQAWNSPRDYSPAELAPRWKMLRGLLDDWFRKTQLPAGN